MIGHVARLASAEERNADGAGDEERDWARRIRGERRAHRATRAVAADRKARRMVAVVTDCLMRRVVIVLGGMSSLSAAVVPRAELSRHCCITAQRQCRDDQQHDQDFEEASHAGNPITADFL
jgi:hypothetical protein